jgi:predicted glycoside hydrolase/deacetylase ChbG (UPF0249 family)
VIVNADDFGFTNGHNAAIDQAHQNGILNRASLLANGWAFSEAIDTAKRCPGLGVGVHLTLNEGRPLTQAGDLGNLVLANGEFYDDLKTLILRWIQGFLKENTVYPEWRTQVERIVNNGVIPTHLDSHKHIHMLPPLLEVIMQLSREFGISYVRLPLSLDALRRGPLGLMLWLFALRARDRMRKAQLRFADNFIGIGDTGRMNKAILVAALRNRRPGVTEIMVHPALPSPDFIAFKKRFSWGNTFQFEEEFRALCDIKPAPEFGLE